jgi:hypothetical protein
MLSKTSSVSRSTAISLSSSSHYSRDERGIRQGEREREGDIILNIYMWEQRERERARESARAREREREK